MEEQSFKNHTRLVPAFHMFLIPLLMLTFIGSLVNLYQSWGNSERIYSAALIAVLSFGVIGVALAGRIFALQAQDRVIRLEENLRHQTLTGKTLDPRLTRGQVIALRFASDAEFPSLASEAVSKNLPSKEVKQAIKKWRVDNHRL